MKRKTAIAILSGGLDSAVALALCQAERYKGLPTVVGCITFRYGQHHSKETDCAEKIAQHYNLPIRVVELPHLWSAVLTSRDGMQLPLPTELSPGHARSIAPTFVPHRNIVMIAVAANAVAGEDALVAGAAAGGVVGGWHGEDVSYPDCSARFLKATEKALTIGGARKFHIWRPLVHYHKATIVEMAYTLDVPIELTWSCYRGEEKQCGRCDACLQRINAFKANDAVDPVPYEIDIDWRT